MDIPSHSMRGKTKKNYPNKKEREKKAKELLE